MQQAKISLNELQIEYINKYKEFGFKDKSSLVRAAIELYIKTIERQKLVDSAKLYAEIYEEDKDIQELTNSTINEWPQ